MMIRLRWSLVALVGASLGLTSLGLAQPIRPPPPPLQRPNPPPRDDHRDPHDDHRDPHDDHRDPHDDHRDPHDDRKDDFRDRMAQREEQERLHRKDLRKDVKTWNDGRLKRALDHRKETTDTWGVSVVNRADARAELSTHADRMARLNRVLDIAEDKGDPAMAARAKNLIGLEIARNSRAMQEIKSRAGVP
jgi:hypothetical protein